FPDPHHIATHRRQVARASSGTLRGAQPNLGRADLQLGCSRLLPRTRPQLQLKFAQGRLRSRRLEELACDLAPFFVGQTTILRRTDDKAMIEFLATNQLFVDVRPAITNVRPLDLFVCRRVAESKTGLLPPLRFARTPLHEFGIVRRFAFRTRLTHVVVLHRQTQDLDCWTTWPTLSLIGFTFPPH